MTPKQMVSGVKQIASDSKYDVVSIGYPGLVHKGKPATEPHNWGVRGSGSISNLRSAAL